MGVLVIQPKSFKKVTQSCGQSYLFNLTPPPPHPSALFSTFSLNLSLDETIKILVLLRMDITKPQIRTILNTHNANLLVNFRFSQLFQGQKVTLPLNLGNLSIVMMLLATSKKRQKDFRRINKDRRYHTNYPLPPLSKVKIRSGNFSKKEEIFYFACRAVISPPIQAENFVKGLKGVVISMIRALVYKK